MSSSGRDSISLAELYLGGPTHPNRTAGTCRRIVAIRTVVMDDGCPLRAVNCLWRADCECHSVPTR